MTDRTFGRAMWDAGAMTWSGDFAWGFLIEALSLFNRGIMAPHELLGAASESEEHYNAYKGYVERGMSPRAALEVLADLPETDPAESRSSAAGAEPLL